MLQINTYHICQTTTNSKSYAIHAFDNWDILFFPGLEQNDVSSVKNILTIIYKSKCPYWDIIGQIQKQGCEINGIYCSGDEFISTIEEIIKEVCLNGNSKN